MFSKRLRLRRFVKLKLHETNIRPLNFHLSNPSLHERLSTRKEKLSLKRNVSSGDKRLYKIDTGARVRPRLDVKCARGKILPTPSQIVPGLHVLQAVLVPE